MMNTNFHLRRSLFVQRRYKFDSYEGSSVTRGITAHEYELVLGILKANRAVKEEMRHDILCLSVCRGI